MGEPTESRETMMRLYTSLGDHGQTDLLGERVSKDDTRIDVLGDLDETTSAIGLGRAQSRREGTGTVLIGVQRDLYRIMAELAFTDETRPDTYRFTADRVTWLETAIEEVSSSITLPREFVLPGETVSGAALDVARSVARRAERAAATLSRLGTIGNPEILRYLNRLSSLLFVLARAEDLHDGEDVRLAKDERAS